MLPAASRIEETVWELPPLILHPFNEQVAPSTLLDNSKAALMLSGLIPGDGSDRDELTRRLLTGRYSEIRMLFFLGKDIFRWIEQCLDWADRYPELKDAELEPQSFADFLTKCPPANVREKLIGWGVADYIAIFARAVDLNSMFAGPPAIETLSEEFLRNYHQYADSLYQCYLEARPYRAIDPQTFRFELYASGEYSRMLESAWESSEG